MQDSAVLRNKLINIAMIPALVMVVVIAVSTVIIESAYGLQMAKIVAITLVITTAACCLVLYKLHPINKLLEGSCKR